MQDSYYNHILENIIHTLRNMKPVYGDDMVEYQQLLVKDFDQIMPQAEALNSYNAGSKRRTKLKPLRKVKPEILPQNFRSGCLSLRVHRRKANPFLSP